MHLLLAQAAEEGGGTSINVGIIGLVVLAIVVAVVLARRRR